MKIGLGYDVHRLVENRKLILGGVDISWEKGLLGHSDADVLVHAIMDAILGALTLGDIGKHFPDNDPKYKGISSIELLRQVGIMMENEGYCLGNIDSVIMAEKPKLSPYIDQMRLKISEALGVSMDRISVKATTTEGLGFVGEGQGIAAQAVVMLNKYGK